MSGPPSPNLEPVSFDNTLMRMGDEKRLRTEVAKALIDQRELFEKRQEYTAAIERNFAILKKVSQRQKEEFRAAMVHSENCTRSYEHLKKDHIALLETHERMSKDLDRLRKKEVEFDLVLANKLQYINKIDLLETQKAKLEGRNGNLQSEIESNAADITQLKRTIFEGEDKIKELEEALRQLDSRGGKLQARVEELQVENQDMTKKLSLLDDQYAISQFKLKKAKADIVDKDDEIAAYKEENDELKTKQTELDETNKELKAKVKSLQKKMANERKHLDEASKVLQDANRESDSMRLKFEKQTELQARQIQDYENKLQRKTKELQTMKEKADSYNKEKQENTMAYNEERQKHKQDIKEANDEINALSHKVDQLEEQRKLEQGSADDMMRELRANYEEQMRDVQDQQRRALLDAQDLKHQLEATEKKYKKETTLSEQYKTRLESATDQLLANGQELTKLKAEHDKVSKRCFKYEERVKKYELAFDNELEKRIGEQMRKSEDNEVRAKELQNDLVNKFSQIERLENTVEDQKRELLEEREQHRKTAQELDDINFRISRQQERLQLMERENEKKLREIDRLMVESDRTKSELSRLYHTYDFNMIDKCNATLDNFSAWAAKLMPSITRIRDVVEQFFNCRLCNSLPLELMIVLPCEHVFCAQCLSNQGNANKCPSCNQDKERQYQSEQMPDLIDMFDAIIQDVNLAKRVYATLDEDYTKIETARRSLAAKC